MTRRIPKIEWKSPRPAVPISPTGELVHFDQVAHVKAMRSRAIQERMAYLLPTIDLLLADGGMPEESRAHVRAVIERFSLSRGLGGAQ